MTKRRVYGLSGNSTFSLQARKQLIELLLRQDKAIQQLFIQNADELAAEIRRYEVTGNAYQLNEVIDTLLQQQASKLEEGLTLILLDGLQLSIEAGIHQSKQATLRILNRAGLDWKPMERSFFRQHTKAVEAMQTRTIKGLNLSDRIWGKSRQSRDAIGSIVREAIAAGEHPYKVAEMLEQYVRNGAGSLVSEYPNMIERLEGNIPMNLSYESLRLARTEMAAAFGEATRQAAELNPSNKGIRWSLSNAGVACDKCRTIASHDEGKGEGVYSLETLPDYPAHPNCLCNLSEVTEDVEDFADRLIEWMANPMAQQDIEHWYQTVYKTGEI
ncbi:hypothetical protein CSV80_00805 [Sporosarcina sp. P12(2017)]|uniref:hypothetical protein n=1 Tax=unclassified Sporosarcina TaxID=2647733 RepID=UPI000C169FBF|nr:MULTISPECIES: hypothetical protein [unclassified Sporosarcina]PIC59095.1 hypothetical protein CSV81_00805 [Sporosarcina sp. P10]PIC62416.1 hypothetical protein CSV80_00805 [Sporosarcina sp. P12(2017)]